MKVISVLNQKGGSGKTTICVHLARAFQLKGKKVVLVDSDPQGSARDWSALNEGNLITVIGMDRPTLSKDIQALANTYDIVFIDGAAQLADMVVSAIKCSDLVVIPVQPSPYDIWATVDLIELVKARQTVTDGKPMAVFIPSRQIKTSKLAKEIRSILAEHQMPILEGGTLQRVAYPKSVIDGSTVFDTQPNSDAAKEMHYLADQIESLLYN
jgi:chromosome partitioning protein